MRELRRDNLFYLLLLAKFNLPVSLTFLINKEEGEKKKTSYFTWLELKKLKRSSRLKRKIIIRSVDAILLAQIQNLLDHLTRIQVLHLLNSQFDWMLLFFLTWLNVISFKHNQPIKKLSEVSSSRFRLKRNAILLTS